MSDTSQNAFNRMDRSMVMLVVGVLVGCLIRVPQLGHSLYESHAFRQTQTAFVIREYARNGIDLLVTPLPIFNPSADVPFEFPLFQGLAALMSKVGLTPEEAGRSLALASFQAAVVLAYVLARRWFGPRVAAVCSALMQFSPFSLAWAASNLIDFFAVALALAMVATLDRYIRSASLLSLASGCMCAWLCVLVKVTTGPPWVLVLVFSYIAVRRLPRSALRTLIALTAGPAVGLVLAAGWTAYADRVKEEVAATTFLSSTNVASWTFGTMEQRLALKPNLDLGFHLFNEVAGPVGLSLLLAVAGVWRGHGTFWHRSGLLLAACLTPVAFFNLYSVHAYYWMATFPAVMILVALGVVTVVERLPVAAARHRRLALVCATVVLLAGAAATTTGRGQLGQFVVAPSTPSFAQEVAAHSEPSEALLIIGCGWDPTLLYASDRAGFMIRDSSAAAMPEQTDMHLYRTMISCDGALDPDDFLPEGYRAVPVEPSLWYRVEKTS